MNEPNFEGVRKEEGMGVHGIPFFCKVGQVEARLDVGIETDPTGNGKGRLAHYHAFPSCPKIDRLSDLWRCRVTKEVCSFWEPFGGYEVEPYKRNFVYIYKLVRYISFIELNGKRLIPVTLKSKGSRSFNGNKFPDLKFHQVLDFLQAPNLIEKDIYKNLLILKNTRNKLIHKANILMAYNENRLSQMVAEAGNLSLKIADILREQEEQLK